MHFIYLRSWNRECALCYSARDQQLPEHFLVFSNGEGPYAFKECRFRSAGTPGAFVVHIECLALIQGQTCMRDCAEILQNLRRLAVSLQYSWAVPERSRSSRSQAISITAAHAQTYQLLASATPLTNTLAHLWRLPFEMRAQVFEMCWPSEFFAVCTNLYVLNFLRSMSEEKPCTDYCDILGQKYLQNLQHDFPSPLLIVRDAVSCRAVGNLTTNIPAVGKHDWYRLVPSTLVATFRPVKKGLLVQDMQSNEHFQSSFLWNCRDPPALRAEECFGLPAKDLTFDAAVQDWIRLNLISVTRNMTGITMACVGGSTIGLFVHDGSDSESDFYKHWDAIFGGNSVTWLCCHIAPAEYLTEIAVCGYLNAHGFTHSDGSLVLYTSTGRCISFAPYLETERRAKYDTRYLVNDAQKMVSHICVNERDRSVSPLRIGLVCCEAPKPREEDVILQQETPYSAPPTYIGYEYRYFSNADVGNFSALEFCIMDYNSLEVCLGLRFHGCGLPKTIGQWRSDKTIRKEKLPTNMTLLNKKRGTRYCVTVCNNEEDLAALKIEGTLEWWIGPRGSELCCYPA